MNSAFRHLAFARRIALLPSIPAKKRLSAIVSEIGEILKTESTDTRPPDTLGLPGGLVELPRLPTILVPDIHARAHFLARLLAWQPPGYKRKVVDLLAAGELNLLCLGDVFHSESGGAASRWKAAMREYLSGWSGHASMDREMALSLSAALLVLVTKLVFPGHFHYLKGNHDNIVNEEGHGDHPFYKFAAEGEMVQSWFQSVYGPELLSAYRSLELDLPLVARGDAFVASHAEPQFPIRPEDVIDYRRRPDIAEALTWTANDQAEAGAVALSLAAFLPGPEKKLWFGGHRPVPGRYLSRAEGLYIQLHNPDALHVAWLVPGRTPDPERDIIAVD